ncbi:hypothetical protein AVEN_112540-1 [Araneus ventricosus]|uniref:Uncharacterized protein n=1 Tax=Araneus ventricosus TaxID=182803 RepID=A0A4Y2L3J6_ARAVE|nr:hypothetical protein AVEN_112540-1 [Araneus ventricosus]
MRTAATSARAKYMQYLEGNVYEPCQNVEDLDGEQSKSYPHLDKIEWIVASKCVFPVAQHQVTPKFQFWDLWIAFAEAYSFELTEAVTTTGCARKVILEAFPIYSQFEERI